jgi:type II secretory pathway pseudopilin PulG
MEKEYIKGFTLLETVVAIAILSSVVTLLLTIIASGITQARYGSQKQTASYLAQEGIELVRNHRATYQLQAKNSATVFSINAGNWGPGIFACTIQCAISISENNSLIDIFSCGSTCPPLYLTEQYGYVNQIAPSSTDKISPFTRTMKVLPTTNTDAVEVVSLVVWKDDRGIENKVEYKTILTSWNE